MTLSLYMCKLKKYTLKKGVICNSEDVKVSHRYRRFNRFTQM